MKIFTICVLALLASEQNAISGDSRATDVTVRFPKVLTAKDYGREPTIYGLKHDCEEMAAQLSTLNETGDSYSVGLIGLKFSCVDTGIGFNGNRLSVITDLVTTVTFTKKVISSFILGGLLLSPIYEGIVPDMLFSKLKFGSKDKYGIRETPWRKTAEGLKWQVVSQEYYYGRRTNTRYYFMIDTTKLKNRDAYTWID